MMMTSKGRKICARVCIPTRTCYISILSPKKTILSTLPQIDHIYTATSVTSAHDSLNWPYGIHEHAIMLNSYIQAIGDEMCHKTVP